MSKGSFQGQELWTCSVPEFLVSEIVAGSRVVQTKVSEAHLHLTDRNLSIRAELKRFVFSAYSNSFPKTHLALAVLTERPLKYLMPTSDYRSNISGRFALIAKLPRSTTCLWMTIRGSAARKEWVFGGGFASDSVASLR